MLPSDIKNDFFFGNRRLWHKEWLLFLVIQKSFDLFFFSVFLSSVSLMTPRTFSSFSFCRFFSNRFILFSSFHNWWLAKSLTNFRFSFLWWNPEHIPYYLLNYEKLFGVSLMRLMTKTTLKKNKSKHFLSYL